MDWDTKQGDMNLVIEDARVRFGKVNPGTLRESACHRFKDWNPTDEDIKEMMIMNQWTIEKK